MPAPSFDDLYNLGKTEAIVKRPRLGFRVGDISDILVSAAAAMADRLIGWFAERIAATFLDGATGDDLTRLVADHWAIQRRDALKSKAQIQISRSGANATLQTLAIGTTVATARDSRGAEIRYLTTNTVEWGVSVNATRVVNVEAEIAGVEGNIPAANLIVRLVSAPPAGGTYTIVSSTLPAGGAEEENDFDLRDRARRYPSTLRRGTLSALEYGALATLGAGVTKANAVQDPSGLVTVYVSDSSGSSSGATHAVDPNLIDDGLMTTRVAVELLKWAPVGSLVNVTGGAVEIVNISAAIAARLGVDVAQLIVNIQTSIAARVNRLTIGDTLFKSDLINSVKAVDPDNIVDVTILAPLVDTVPTTPGNIIRAGTITVS